MPILLDVPLMTLQVGAEGRDIPAPEPPRAGQSFFPAGRMENEKSGRRRLSRGPSGPGRSRRPPAIPSGNRPGSRLRQFRSRKDYLPPLVPISSPETMISTRRFFAFPSGVSFVATGEALPSPLAVRDVAAIPFSVR